jgi:hypothetical protein
VKSGPWRTVGWTYDKLYSPGTEGSYQNYELFCSKDTTLAGAITVTLTD